MILFSLDKSLEEATKEKDEVSKKVIEIEAELSGKLKEVAEELDAASVAKQLLQAELEQVKVQLSNSEELHATFKQSTEERINNISQFEEEANKAKGEVEEMAGKVEEMKRQVQKAEEQTKEEQERAEQGQADKMTAELAQWALDEKLQVIEMYSS